MNQLTKRQKELLHDEDVKTIAIQFAEIAVQKKDNQVFYIDRIFNSFASQFEDKKDWEIISFSPIKSDGSPPTFFAGDYDIWIKERLRDGRKIHSVKYKDQVFTIGDVVEHNGNTLKISEFEVDEKRLKVWFLKGTWLFISEVKKVERKVRCEQICIEEKIELLDKLIKWISDGNADGMTPMLSIIAKQNSIKHQLQNQLNNLK